jgi:DNA ligase-1
VKTYARKKKARVVEEDDEEDIELDFEPMKTSPMKRPVSDSESNDSPIKRCKRVRRAIESSDEEDGEEGKEKSDEVVETKENRSNNLSAKKKTSPKAKAKATPKDKPATKRGRKSNKAKAEEHEMEEESKPAKKAPKKKASPVKTNTDESEDTGKGERQKSPQKKDSLKKEKKDSDEEIRKEEETKAPSSAAKKSQGSLAAFFKPKGADSAASTTSSDESGSKFSEALKRAQYHPVDNAMWKRGQPTPYQAFARALEAIEGTSGRLKTIEILANYFRSVMVLTPSDLIPSVYMCLNRLAPEYEGIELGIGDMLLMKAIAQTTGRSLQQVRTDANKIGDLGEVAETSRGSQKTMFTPAPLTVPGVFAKLKEVSALTGQASTSNKVAKIQGLLVACRGVEARYLVRSLAGKLRIGLAEQSVLQALAHACVMTPPTGLSDSPSEKDMCAFKTSASDGFKEALEKEALALKTAYWYCDASSFSL